MIPVFQVSAHALRKASELIAKIVAQHGAGFFTRDRVFVLTIEVVGDGVDWNLFTQAPEKLTARGQACYRIVSQYHAALASGPGVPVLCSYRKAEEFYSWVASVAPGLVQAQGSA